MEDKSEGYFAWVLELGPLEFLLLAGFVAVFVLIFFVIAYQKLRAYRIVHDTPTARIRSAPQGYTEIKGEFAPLDGEPVQAPFSGKPCAWYRAWIEQKQGDDENKSWDTVFEEADPRPCVLRDGTGECLVLPAAADMRVGVTSETWYPDRWFNDPPEPLSHVETGLLEGSVRFREERIEAGPGYAIGRLTTTDGSDGGEAVDTMVTVCEQWHTDYMARVEGRPDKERPNPRGDDWDEHQAPHAIARWLQRRGIAEGAVNVVGATEEARRPFIVGSGGEQEVIKRLRRSWAGFSIAFLATGTLLVALLLARAGLLG